MALQGRWGHSPSPGCEKGMHAAGSDAASAPHIHPLPRFPHKTTVPWSLSPPPPPAWLRLVCTLHPGFLHGISWYRWDGKKRPICGLRFKRYLTERRSAPCSEGSWWRTHHSSAEKTCRAVPAEPSPKLSASTPGGAVILVLTQGERQQLQLSSAVWL